MQILPPDKYKPALHKFKQVPISTLFSRSVVEKHVKGTVYVDSVSNPKAFYMETLQEYRRKGLASIICAKLIDYCLDNGLEPVWSCRESNAGSYYLALKSGFEPVASLPYYELKI